MKIICPHCKKEFNETDAIIRPRKEKYKWYEFSGKVSVCPNCNNRYIADISKTGLVFVFTVFAVLLFCVVSEYNNTAMVVALISAATLKLFREHFLIVKGVN